MNSLCFSHFGDFFYYSFNYDREFGGTICWVDCCFFFFRNPVLFLRPCPKRLVGTNNHVPHSHQVVCVTRGVWPSAHHTREGQRGGSALLLVLVTSCFSLSTVIPHTHNLKSQILIVGSVAAQSQ